MFFCTSNYKKSHTLQYAKQYLTIIFTTILLIFLYLVPVSAQRIEEDKDLYGTSLKQIVQAGDQALNIDKDYYTAMRHYQNAVELKPAEVEYIYKYAEAARLAKSYDIAEANYTEVIYLRKKKNYPLARFWLAQIQQMLGKYTDAITTYEEFIKNQLGNEEVGSYYLDKAKREKIACNWSKEEIQPQQNIAIQALGAEVNTPNKEFAAFTLGDTLFYSSTNFYKEEAVTARPYSKIMFSVKGEKGKVLEEDNINITDQHVANLTYNAEQTIKAFTRCEYLTDYSTEIRCKIYIQKKDNKGNWSSPQLLPKYIQQPDKNYTHPSIGRNANDDKDYLYYVSDQEGGLGKLDIWAVKISSDGSYGMPQNLKDINTIENDITPFFHDPSQTLYYSTEGRKGFGSFDIFKAEKGAKKWLKSENLGSPINSSLGDISFSLNKSGSKGYFASNRKGSTYLEKRFESCCDDLYSVEFDNNINLIVQTFDAASMNDLKGAEIEIAELRKDGSTLFLDRLSNPLGNDFSFDVKKGRTYELKAQKNAYTEVTAQLEVPTDAQEIIEKDIYLQPIEIDLQVLVFDLEDGIPLAGAHVQILEEQDNGIKKLIEEQFNEFGNDFVFPLHSNRKYTIRSTKKGYKPLQDITLNTKETSESKTFLAELYMKRITFTDYLPLVIYFDNDYPDVDSRSSTTDTDYAEMIVDYMAKKEEYKLLFTEPIDEEEAFLTAQRYENFFEREVKQGYEDLIDFTQTLVNFLENGNEISLQLKGYASPRAEDKYNFSLSARRIVSVENFFRSYKRGILMPYIQNGQLNFAQSPYGESTTYFLNDLLEDERGSIYSIGASLERRVELIQAEIKINDNEDSFVTFPVKSDKE
ncbi:MAG: hypothetical protein AAF849_20285 [Bacteroidota bacterium]